MNILYSTKFQNNLTNTKNPYGNGFASNKIIEVIQEGEIPKELKKEFYNL